MPRGVNKTGRNGPKFVQMFLWVMDTEAWITMPPGAKLLYLELKKRYTGSNNGKIYLSHRDAAKALGVHRNSIGHWFKILQQHGFAVMTCGPHLGPSGVGIASTWALTELPTEDGRRATLAFKQYKSPAQKPCITVTNSVRPRKVGEAHAQKM